MLTSIRIKMLLLLGGVVVCTLASFILTNYLITEGHVRQRQEEVLTVFAREAKKDFELALATRKQYFKALSLGDPVEAFAERYQEGLITEYFGRYHDYFPVISFASFQGKEEMRIDHGRPSDEHRDLKEHNLSSFTKAVDNPGTVYHDTLERWEGEPFFHLFFARKSFFDEEIGVVVGEMPLRTLTRDLSDPGIHSSGYLALVDGAGNLLFRTDGIADGPRGTGQTGGEFFFSAPPSGDGGTLRADLDGTDSLVAYLPMPELGLTILAVVSHAEVLANLKRITALIISLSIIILAIGAILAVFVANSFVKPLEELKEAADDMARGDISRQAKVAAKDEIGVLAESFNRMGRSLRESYEELEKRNVELLKLDRMKDALMSDVSHELKTPVAKQSMQLEMLNHEVRRGSAPTEQMQEILVVMESNIRRQQNVIRNILMVSRLEAGGRELKIEEVGLDQLMEDVVADHMHLIAACGIRLEEQVAPETVRADREMLWHVFSNSVSNAIKYRAAEDPLIRITVGGSDGTVEVRVEDNGVGLAPEEVERVFERFFQATPTAEGIGLGLSISKEIVEMMGGTIRIESRGKSQGTTVIVNLPLSRT